MREQVIVANEQIKGMEAEAERNFSERQGQSEKIRSLKEKRRELKNEIRGLCDEKLELEVQRSGLDKELNET